MDSLATHYGIERAVVYATARRANTHDELLNELATYYGINIDVTDKHKLAKNAKIA